MAAALAAVAMASSSQFWMAELHDTGELITWQNGIDGRKGSGAARRHGGVIIKFCGHTRDLSGTHHMLLLLLLISVSYDIHHEFKVTNRRTVTLLYTVLP